MGFACSYLGQVPGEMLKSMAKPEVFNLFQGTWFERYDHKIVDLNHVIVHLDVGKRNFAYI